MILTRPTDLAIAWTLTDPEVLWRLTTNVSRSGSWPTRTALAPLNALWSWIITGIQYITSHGVLWCKE